MTDTTARTSSDSPSTQVSALEVRVLRPDEYRAANTLFRAAMHHGPASDEAWELRGQSYAAGRVFGAFRDGTLVGTALSYDSGRMLVPGGEMLPMAMVTAVGVRADATRRGVLTELMRAQLTNCPDPVATLRASEARIYGRFGYGVASRGRAVTVDRRRAEFRPEAPGTTGTTRIMPWDESWELQPPMYDAICAAGQRRPGWAARPEGWWHATRQWAVEDKNPHLLAVHTGPDGDDGFMVYSARYDQETKRFVLRMDDLFAANAEAWAALWRFALSVDLVDNVRVVLRPLDEPIEQLFTDRRAASTTDNEDEVWLRLVDVPAALAARTFGEFAAETGSVVLEVRDSFLPGNSGRYRIGDGPARRVDEPADLTMDVDVLASLYLGDVAPSALAATGRITAAKADAVPVADRLFAVASAPWCGTFF